MDDNTKISIEIDKHFIERIFYWAIIIGLVILVAVLWLRDPACDDAAAKTTTGGAAVPTKGTAADDVAAPTTPTVAAPDCSDADKNGDETDVDCGGSCELKCARNRACLKDGDCIVGLACVGNICGGTAPAKNATNTTNTTNTTGALSGKVEIEVKKVNYKVNADSDAVQVLGITYDIINGGDRLTTPIIKVYIRGRSNVKCVNQVDASEGGCDKEFATFRASSVNAGQSLHEEHVFTKDEAPGSYLQDKDSTVWSKGDPFYVWAYLYNKDGALIGTSEISASLKVQP